MMKKMLFALAMSFVIVGAGCVKGEEVKTVEGPWTLAFDLPEGWVMVRPYKEKAPDVNAQIQKTDSEIWLQSTDKYIWPSTGFAPDAEKAEALGGVVQTNYVRISVTRLDPRRAIPFDAEEIGGDFLRQKLFEEDSEERLGGNLHFSYFLKTADANYQFSVNENGFALEDIERVIKSAQVIEDPSL